MDQTITTTAAPTQLSLLDLEQLEGTVRAGLKTFVDVGHALQKINASEAFKLRGYANMSQYCEKEFGISYQTGQRLIASAVAADKIREITGELPKSEAAVRELEPVIENKTTLKQVAAELKKAGATVATATAETIKTAVRHVVEKRDGKQADLIQPKPPTPKKIEEAPAINTAPVAALDFCPGCGSVPESYVRKGDTWQCPDCGASVVLNVQPLITQ